MTIACQVCTATTDANLCPRCADQLDTAFGDLPALADDVAIAMTRLSRVHRPNGRPREPDLDWRGSADAIGQSPMPLDVDATALLAKLGNTLTTWARHIAETRGAALPALDIPARFQVARIVTVERNRWRITEETRVVRQHQRLRADVAVSRWLLANRDAIRFDEAAGEIHREITALRDELRRAVDSRPQPLFAGPCRADTTDVATEHRAGTVYTITRRVRCDRDLYRWPGKDTVTCDGYRQRDGQGCGTTHTLRGRETWLVESVEDALVPLDVLRAYLTDEPLNLRWPPSATIRSWRFRDKLTVQGVDRTGRELFRGGDVLAMLRTWGESSAAWRADTPA